MLTKDFLFGMNIVSLAGFLVMGFGLTLSRQGRTRVPAAFVLMGTGTALLFWGMHIAAPP